MVYTCRYVILCTKRSAEQKKLAYKHTIVSQKNNNWHIQSQEKKGNSITSKR